MAARILVIDDTQAHLDLFRLILEAEAYDVQVASSSFQNAVDIEQLAPDLIILDYHLNAQSDEEPLLHKLKAYQPTASIPVIICTADVEAMRNQKDALREQGVRVVLKPFDIDDLVFQARQAMH